jgi:hypothetical protein
MEPPATPARWWYQFLLIRPAVGVSLVKEPNIMKTKRILRWAIVLFLLAVLPVMTVALAQDQEPAGKAPLPAVTEPGESLSPVAADLGESEANNTRATADQTYLGYVMSGEIGNEGDVDYFKIYDEFAEYFLIDIDAGNYLDSLVCLWDSAGNVLECNDDSETVDSLLFHAVPEAYTYYISVTDYYGDGWSEGYEYNLIVTTPVLVSAAPANLGTGTVAGIPFQSGDVLAWSDLVYQPDKWLMFFDASDVGVKTLTNLAAEDWGGRMLFTVGAAQTLPGLGTVKPHDILVFTPAEDSYGQEGYGGTTRGSVGMFLKGSQNNLTTTTEKLDAIDGWSGACNGYPVSTVGLASGFWDYGVPMKQDDEDVFCINWDGDPYIWEVFFDVNGVNDYSSSPRTIAGLPAEDVMGTANIDTYNRIALLIQGTGKIQNHAVNQKDIFSIIWSNNTWGGYLWRGPQRGWNYNLDAFEMSDYEYLYSSGAAMDDSSQLER